MKQLILLALIALVIVSAAAWPQSRKEPSKPKWPKVLSATVHWRANHYPHNLYYRVNLEESKLRARVDALIEKNGLLEKVFMILNFKDMKAHIVRHSLHNTRTICFYTEIKKNHTHPDFDKAEFKGNAIVDYHLSTTGNLSWRINICVSMTLKRTEKSRGLAIWFHPRVGLEACTYLFSESQPLVSETSFFGRTFHEINISKDIHDGLFDIPDIIEDQCYEKKASVEDEQLMESALFMLV